MYKVQCGAYSVKKNAENMVNTLKSKGFAAFVTTVAGTQVDTSTSKPSVNYTAVAKAVIRGDYGNGSARRNKLVSKFGKDGADKIQAIVNKLCS